MQNQTASRVVAILIVVVIVTIIALTVIPNWIASRARADVPKIFKGITAPLSPAACSNETKFTMKTTIVDMEAKAKAGHIETKDNLRRAKKVAKIVCDVT